MEILAQQLSNGLIFGSTYALLAFAVALIFGVLYVPNFALGALYMLAAYVCYYLIHLWDLPYLLTIVAAMALMAVVAVFMELLVFRPLESGPHVAGFIGALGLFLILENAAFIGFGAHQRVISSPFTGMVLELGPLRLTVQRVLVFFAGTGIAIVTYLLLLKTKIGKQVRAVSQNKEAAAIIGIDSNLVNYTAFAISGLLAAAAGGLVAPMALVSPSMGMMPITKAFTVVVLGGMGSIPGAILGGYLLGLVEVLGAGYISSAYKDCFAFGVLVLVLMIKPTGFFGTIELRE
jgi:branched-chain amino acid transport system permease protein